MHLTATKSSRLGVSNIVSTPPWLLMRPVINYSLHSADKADIPVATHKYRFTNFVISTWITVEYIYTDGSKVEELVASAIVYKGITKCVRLPDLTSIFRITCFISGTRCYSPVKVEKNVIFSDSHRIVRIRQATYLVTLAQ